MSKFKVGDRVVVVKNNHPIQLGYLFERGEVVSVSSETEYEVSVRRDGCTQPNCFDSSELEHQDIYDQLSSPAVMVDSRPADEQGEAASQDVVNHPSHYTSHPSGVECIQVTEHMNFNLGNAVKYIWRAGLKSDDPIQDLHKARWYIEREIQRLGGTVE